MADEAVQVHRPILYLSTLGRGVKFRSGSIDFLYVTLCLFRARGFENLE